MIPDLLLAVLVGAACTLAGVILGGWLKGRSY